VHKDTFSCVVAEALALGTSVVTYPLGALPENFDKYVHWLDFPAGADPVAMQKESLSKDLDGKFKTTSNIVDKINFLEANPDVKNSMKEAGRKYVLDSFNINKVGGMWVDFIEKLMS
jgi:glycosyltransferase involved in cell wall biosynthesis